MVRLMSKSSFAEFDSQAESVDCGLIQSSVVLYVYINIVEL